MQPRSCPPSVSVTKEAPSSSRRGVRDEESKGGRVSPLIPCSSASRARRSNVFCSSGVSLSSMPCLFLAELCSGIVQLPIDPIMIHQRASVSLASRRDHFGHEQCIFTDRYGLQHPAI